MSLMELAETIHKARWPEDRQMDITPFADEDKNGRDYCFRIARAIAARLQGREALIEQCAKVADSFTCGTCGMDGKAGAAIRALTPAVAPDGAGEAMQERIAKLSEVLARFHRNACYPDAMPHELYQAATEIVALAQAQEPGEDKR